MTDLAATAGELGELISLYERAYRRVQMPRSSPRWANDAAAALCAFYKAAVPYAPFWNAIAASDGIASSMAIDMAGWISAEHELLIRAGVADDIADQIITDLSSSLRQYRGQQLPDGDVLRRQVALVQFHVCSTNIDFDAPERQLERRRQIKQASQTAGKIVAGAATAVLAGPYIAVVVAIAIAIGLEVGPDIDDLRHRDDD